jgi:hypothetical protein
MEAEDFQVALRRRLRVPLPLGAHVCGESNHPGCRAALDAFGDHLASCNRTGLLARRAKPVERAWVRIARESGARVAPQQLLRDTNVPLANPADRRQLDLVIYGASVHGLPLCCDATMVSPLRADGQPHPRTDSNDGVALDAATRRKRRTYRELGSGRYGKLLVLSCEVGGRWGPDSLKLVAQLAKQKARAAPALLRGAARAAWLARWWGLLSVAAQSALAATLRGAPALALGGASGEDELDLGEVLQFP